MIIEEIEDKSLQDIFHARIFAPLGMAHSFLWNDIPKPEFGLPRAYLAAPFIYETTDWNLSQGWAAGGVISTTDDMHVFIEALLSGKLFHTPETLAEMQKTIPTGSLVAPTYGIGLSEKESELWGHGGQTLGFASDVADNPSQQISLVVWATSSKNGAELGAALIADALRKAGALPAK